MTDPAPPFEYDHMLHHTTTGQLHRVSRLPGLDHDVKDSIRVGRPFPRSLELQDIEEGSVTVGPPALGKDTARRDLARIAVNMSSDKLGDGDAAQKAEAPG